MTCYYHPNTKAKAICIKCSKSLCMDCVAVSPNCPECDEKDKQKALEQERLKKAPPLTPKRIAANILVCAIFSVGLSYFWAFLNNSQLSVVYFAFFFFAPFGWRFINISFERPINIRTIQNSGEIQQDMVHWLAKFTFDPGQVFAFFFSVFKAVVAAIIGPVAFIALACLYLYNLKKFKKSL